MQNQEHYDDRRRLALAAARRRQRIMGLSGDRAMADNELAKDDVMTCAAWDKRALLADIPAAAAAAKARRAAAAAAKARKDVVQEWLYDDPRFASDVLDLFKVLDDHEVMKMLATPQ